MNRLFLTVSLVLTASVFPATAGDLLQELKQCKEITNSNKRLACFDAITVAKETPQTAPKVTQVRAEEPKVIAKSPAPVKERVLTKEEFGLKNIIKEPEFIKLTVKKVKKDPYGEITVYLEEGQVWKQTDGRALRLKQGDKIVIKKGSFNSFNLMKAEGSRTMRVKRIK